MEGYTHTHTLPLPCPSLCCSAGDKWEGRAYTRAVGAFPAPWVREGKLWPTVGRVDNVHGDRHLVCTCPPVEAYA